MNFYCVACCVRWLSSMSKEEMKFNAPTIEYIAGKEHMDKVRKAWKKKI